MPTSTALLPPAAPSPIGDRLARGLTDEQLLVLVRTGSASAYSELYRRHATEVRRFARTLVPASDVDDIVSDAFMRTLQAISRGHGPVDSPIRYLMVTVRNVSLTLHAARARDLAATLADKPERTARAADASETDERMIAAFGSLHPRWRQVLWWIDVEGFTAAEVAAEVDTSPNAVSALVYRARTALRAAYVAEGDRARARADA
ncbi:RNA polymerase sigma factor [Aquihabitans sp. McL0605]|uniref:RNA polymerase sigma factor n=1 Tax=Aquihabitans sp. McL0605 TaxID=3415671 RepID=UPI003CF50960